MARKFCLSFFIFIGFIGLCQESKIDSLTSQLKKNLIENNRIIILKKIVREYTNKSLYSDGHKFLDSLYSTELIIKNKRLLALWYRSKGVIYGYEGRSDTAILYLRNGLKHLENEKTEKLAGDIYRNIGDEMMFKRNDSLFYYYNKAENIYQNIGEKEGLCYIYDNTAHYYYSNNDYHKCAVFLDKLIVLNKEVGDLDLEGRCYNLLGLLHLDIGDYEIAKSNFNKAIKVFRNVSNYYETAINLFSLGETQFKKGEQNQAIKSFEMAIDLFEDKNLLKGSEGIYAWKLNLLTSFLLDLKRTKEAKKYYKLVQDIYLEKGLDYLTPRLAINSARLSYDHNALDNAFLELKKINYNQLVIEDKKDYLQVLIELNSKANNLESVVDLQKKYYSINDSIRSRTLQNNIVYTSELLETEKKEQELNRQKLATQEQELLTQKANTRNWLLAIGLLGLLISAFFIWRRYKSEAKAKQIISEQKSQIELLQKEFHHRLKNDSRSIKRFIGLVQKKFPETEFQERLDELKNRINSMFKVHETLVNEDDITQVNASTFLRDLSHNVESKYREDSIKVICNVSDKETIMADKAIPFGVVLNEFVTNSYKYAFDDNGGEIKIHFVSDDDHHHLTLEDNGKGLPKDFDMDNLRSLGLTVIPMFAELHDGDYTLESNDGVKLKLTLPKKVA